jgi:hypothetical protein
VELITPPEEPTAALWMDVENKSALAIRELLCQNSTTSPIPTDRSAAGLSLF